MTLVHAAASRPDAGPRMRTARRTALLLALLLAAALLPPGGAREAAGDPPGSTWDGGGSFAPESFTAQQGQACDGTQPVGLLQDNIPWAAAASQDPLGANYTELTLLDVDFCLFPSSALGSLDLGQFGVIVISSAQTQAFYDNLFPGGSVHADVTAWVEAGGTLVAHLADVASGPGGGSWGGRTFVGGLTRVTSSSNDNSILAPEHPVVAATAACPSGNCEEIVDTGIYQDLDGWGASSHGFFANVPPQAVTVLGGPNEFQPVYVEYPHGQGTVLATMTTIEWRYVGGFASVPLNRKLLANELAYALVAGSPVSLSPAIARAPAVEDLWHRVTALVVDPDTGAPRLGIDVDFAVTFGPNSGVVGRCGPPGPLGQPFGQNVCRTDHHGHASWFYQYGHPTGAQLGTDHILAVAAGYGTAPATMQWLEPADYAALGDSYSSGLGARPYFPDVPRCNRSRVAYATRAAPPGYRGSVHAYHVNTGGEVGWRFVACQGATTEELLTEPQFGEPPQVDRLDHDVNFMTLTIAGNDAGFSSVLLKCLWHQCLDWEWQDTGQTLRQWLPERIESMGPVLVAVYEELLAASGDAPLFVLGYPQLFPASAGEQSCTKLFPWSDKMDFFRDMGDLMDQVIEDAAAEAGVHFVPVSEHFAGHEVCGGDGEWMRGPSPGHLRGSFHPDSRGQAEYALALNAAMAGLVTAGAPTEPTGVPTNPGAGVGALTAPTPLPTVGDLEIEPLDSRPPDACPGAVRPAVDVRLTGDGFAPSSQVTVTAGHDGQAVVVATTTADASGHVDVVVTVPAGFDPPTVTDPEQLYQRETTVGFEIYGESPDGTERLLVGATGLSQELVLCDVTEPAIHLAAPLEGATYEVDEHVEADYACSDEPGGSGIAVCLGDVPSGTPLDTSLPGTYTFTVVAVDEHGNAAESTVAYTVALAVTDPGPADFLAQCGSQGGAHWWFRWVDTSWSAMPGATAYNLYHQQVGAGGQPLADPVLRWSGTATSFRDFYPPPDALLDYWVTATLPGGESGPSSVIRVSTTYPGGCPPEASH